MQIFNNSQAFLANKFYRANLTSLRTSMGKLSTGLRIQRAGDDPAGLSLSERMRVQIRNSASAAENIDNAISRSQSADGWLQKIQDIIRRMGVLAISSLDGTKSAADIRKLEDEYTQMQNEIMRIVENNEAAASFNGNTLFQGEDIQLQIGADSGQNILIEGINLSSTYEEIMPAARIYPTDDNSSFGLEGAVQQSQPEVSDISFYTTGVGVATLTAIQNTTPGTEITAGSYEFIYELDPSKEGRWRQFKDGIDQGVTFALGDVLQIDGLDGWEFEVSAAGTGSYSVGDKFTVTTTAYSEGVPGTIGPVNFVDAATTGTAGSNIAGDGSGISNADWRAIYDAANTRWDIQRDTGSGFSNYTYMSADPDAGGTIQLEGANGFNLTISAPSSGSYADGDRFDWTNLAAYIDPSPSGLQNIVATNGTALLTEEGNGSGISDADWRAIYDADNLRWDIQKDSGSGFANVTYLSSNPDTGGSIILEGADGFNLTISAPSTGTYTEGDIFEWSGTNATVDPSPSSLQNSIATTGAASVTEAGNGSSISDADWRAIYDPLNTRWEIQKDTGGGFIHDSYLSLSPDSGGAIQLDGANGFTFTVNAPTTGTYTSSDMFEWSSNSYTLESTALAFSDIATTATSGLANAGDGSGITASDWRAVYDAANARWKIEQDSGGGFSHVTYLNLAPDAGGTIQLEGANGFDYTITSPTAGTYTDGDTYNWTNTAGNVDAAPPAFSDYLTVTGSSIAISGDGGGITTADWRATYDYDNSRWDIERDTGSGFSHVTYLNAGPTTGGSVTLDGIDGFDFSINAPTTGSYADGHRFTWSNTAAESDNSSMLFTDTGTAGTVSVSKLNNGEGISDSDWRATYDFTNSRWDIERDIGGGFVHYTYLNAAPDSGGTVELEGSNGFNFTINSPTLGTYADGQRFTWTNDGSDTNQSSLNFTDTTTAGTSSLSQEGSGSNISNSAWRATYEVVNDRWNLERNYGSGWNHVTYMAAAPDGGSSIVLEGADGFRFTVNAPTTGAYADGQRYSWTNTADAGSSSFSHLATVGNATASGIGNEAAGADEPGASYSAVYDYPSDTWTIAGVGSCLTGGYIDLPTANGWDDVVRFSPQASNYSTGDRFDITTVPGGAGTWSYHQNVHGASLTISNDEAVDDAAFILTYDETGQRWEVQRSMHDPTSGEDAAFSFVEYIADDGSGISGHEIAGSGITIDITPDINSYHDGDRIEFSSVEPLRWNNVFNTSLLTQESRWRASMYTQAAIDHISEKRTILGATQTRLEHARVGLRNYESNMRSSESRIRDVDVARETAEFSKSLVMTQVSRAMVAQANQSVRNVLTLLNRIEFGY